jgi:hypothetical protein
VFAEVVLVKHAEALKVVAQMGSFSYWTKENTIEFFAFMAKIAIIFPGLLFGQQWWWLYLIALCSSSLLVWTSTVKTLPTIILFNCAWICLALIALGQHFF